MSPSETKSKSTASGSELEVISYNDKDPLGPSFTVKSPMGHILQISDTYAERYHHTETPDSVLSEPPFFSGMHV